MKNHQQTRTRIHHLSSPFPPPTGTALRQYIFIQRRNLPNYSLTLELKRTESNQDSKTQLLSILEHHSMSERRPNPQSKVGHHLTSNCKSQRGGEVAQRFHGPQNSARLQGVHGTGRRTCQRISLAAGEHAHFFVLRTCGTAASLILPFC